MTTGKYADAQEQGRLDDWLHGLRAAKDRLRAENAELHAALDEAGRYKSRIDVIFVGPETSPAGRNFFGQLARASGGQQVTADRAVALADSAKRLLAVGT